MLEVKSFTFAHLWMALVQPGYDSVDNVSGVLVKTAGYPGGLSSSASFGTISFSAKKAGSGVITIGDNSLAFAATSQSVLRAAPISLSITAAPSAVSDQSQENAVPENAPIEPTSAESATASAPEPVAEQPASPSLLSAAGALLALGGGNALVGLLVILIILALIAYGVYSSMRNRKQ